MRMQGMRRLFSLSAFFVCVVVLLSVTVFSFTTATDLTYDNYGRSYHPTNEHNSHDYRSYGHNNHHSASVGNAHYDVHNSYDQERHYSQPPQREHHADSYSRSRDDHREYPRSSSSYPQSHHDDARPSTSRYSHNEHQEVNHHDVVHHSPSHEEYPHHEGHDVHHQYSPQESHHEPPHHESYRPAPTAPMRSEPHHAQLDPPRYANPRPHVAPASSDHKPVRKPPQYVRMHQPEHFRSMAVRLIDSPVGDIKWAVKKAPNGGFLLHVAFAVTAEGKLYRSVDAGHTWENQSEKLGHATVLSVAVSKADQAHIAVRTREGVNFFSSDAGDTFHMPRKIVYLQHRERSRPAPDGAQTVSARSTSSFFGAAGMSSDPLSFLSDFASTFRPEVAQEGEHAEGDVPEDRPPTPHEVQMQEAFLVTQLEMHPTRAGYMLAATESRGCARGGSRAEHRAVDESGEWEDEADENKDMCFLRLLVTKDNGRNWVQIATHVVQFAWAPKEAYGRDGVTEDSIFVCGYLDNRYQPVSSSWDKNIHFIHTNDYFRSWEVSVQHGNRFFIGKSGYFFVAAVNVDKTGVTADDEVLLMVRSPHHPTFEKAYLPVQSLKQFSYNILDSNEDQVFLQVNHNPVHEFADSGHIYISDQTGTLYSLSLPNVIRNAQGHAAFVRVQALEGIFLANFLAPDAQLTAQQGFDFDPDSSSSMAQYDSSAAGVSGDGPTTVNGNMDAPRRIMTSITFNKGAEWFFLEPPKADCDGNPILCDPNAQGQACKLHLHSIAPGGFGAFYSDERAPGLILGTGSVGHQVQHSNVNTYLSRDGGLTWHEVFKGSHIFEFGDHGGLIVMAPDTKPTDTLFFSWDEGATWEGVQITDTPFMVENIVTEPDNVDVKFVIYGYIPRSGGNGHGGVMMFIDFADLHTRECKGHLTPGAPDSDYEWWTPHDERLDGQCLMGHSTHILRRKQFAQCFNPLQRAQMSLAQLTHRQDCVCSAHDFACDYGFTRVEEGGPCVPDTTGPYPSLEAVLAESARTCGKDGYYHATRGYRKVPGNTCVGGEQWLPEKRACPRKVTLGAVLLVLVLLGGAAWVLLQLHQKYDLAQVAVDLIDKWNGRRPYTLVKDSDTNEQGEEDEETAAWGSKKTKSPTSGRYEGLGATDDRVLTLSDVEGEMGAAAAIAPLAPVADSDVDADLSSAGGVYRAHSSIVVDSNIGPLAPVKPVARGQALVALPKPPSHEGTRDLLGLESE